MKYGCCLNMIASKSDKTGIEHLRRLAMSGYDYVELPLAEIMDLSESQFNTLIIDELERYNIQCEVCNNFFPGTIRLTGDDVDCQRIMDYVNRALNRAKSLGVQYVVFGSGKAKHVPDGYHLEKGYLQIVELLKLIGPVAESKGITIVIEPLRKEECNLINTFEEGCRLASDVNHKSVRVLVDFYHMTIEKEPLIHLEQKGREYLRHVHFANPNGRVYPGTLQEADYIPFFQVLKKIGYNQRISCEAYTDNYDISAGIALNILKNSMNN